MCLRRSRWSTSPPPPESKRDTPRLVVTTSKHHPDDNRPRAEAVAARCGVPFVERRGRVDVLYAENDIDWLYVVAHDRERLLHKSGREVFVHPGLTASKVRHGRAHPLARAVWPDDEDAPTTVLDATLGMAGDALHIAAITGARIRGVEASAVIVCLAEAGLMRMTTEVRKLWAEPATRISAEHNRAADVLATLEDGAVDIVYLDPMMERPTTAAPGFDLFRKFTLRDALDRALLKDAARVASRRVVLKMRNDEEQPPAGIDWHRRERGTAVDFLVAERGKAAPS